MSDQFQLRLPMAVLVYWLGSNGGQKTIQPAAYAQARATHFQVKDEGDAIKFGLLTVEDAEELAPEDVLGDFYARVLPATIFAKTAMTSIPKKVLNGIGVSRPGVLYWKKADGSTVLSLINEGSGVEELLRGRHESDIMFFSSSAASKPHHLDA